MSKKTLRLDLKQVQQALQSAEGKLPNEVHKLFQDVAASYAYLADLVSDQTMTVDRLRETLWGTRPERSNAEIDRSTNPETPPRGDGGSGDDA